MDKKNSIAIDLLRILAAFSVVVIHVTSKYIECFSVDTEVFTCANLVNSLSRFGVPVFVMISGYIFLSKEEISVKRLWSHNIIRIFFAYWIWSFAYYVFQSLYLWQFDFWNQGLIRTINGCVYASNHFWFLFMLMGLYALTPLIHGWIRHATKRDVEYVLVLFFVFQIMRMTMMNLVDKSLVAKLGDLFQIHELSYYLGYYILGYYVFHYGIGKKLQGVLLGMVPLGVAANFGISQYLSRKNASYHPGIYDSYGIFTCCFCVLLVVLMKDYVAKLFIKRSQKFRNWIHNRALDTFGIYLMHLMLITFLYEEHYFFGDIPTIMEIILICVFCYCASGIAATVLRRIPYVGRFIC